MITLHNGQEVTTTGWFVDKHGHQLFLQRGQLAPICPHSGPSAALWRLTREVADLPDDDDLQSRPAA